MILILLKLLLTAHADTNPFFSDLENFKLKSLSLQTEEQNLEASGDLLLSKKLFWTPKLNLSVEKNKTKLNSRIINDSDSINADLNLNLFNGGADWNELREAQFQKKAQELQVLNEGLRVEVKASDLIFKALYINESKKIEEQLLKLKEESLKIVKDRYSQGKIPLQEVNKSEVDLSQQKNKLRSTQLEQSENTSYISSLFVTTIQTKGWPFDETTLPKILDGAKSPVSEQKQLASQAKEFSWKAAKGLHFPTLDLRLQYELSPIKERSNKQLSGLVVLTLPIWNQNESSSVVANSYTQYISALNDYKEAEQASSQRTIFLKQKIEIARLNLSESKRNLALSKRLYDDILRSFRLGRISTNDLIIEQNRLLESENNLALSQLTFHQGIIEACTLSGLKSSECLK